MVAGPRRLGQAMICLPKNPLAQSCLKNRPCPGLSSSSQMSDTEDCASLFRKGPAGSVGPGGLEVVARVLGGGGGLRPPSGQLSNPPAQPVALRSCGGPRHSPGGRRRSPGAGARAGALEGPLRSGLGGQATQASAPARQSARGCAGERGCGRPCAARSARVTGTTLRPPPAPRPFRP